MSRRVSRTRSRLHSHSLFSFSASALFCTTMALGVSGCTKEGEKDPAAEAKKAAEGAVADAKQAVKDGADKVAGAVGGVPMVGGPAIAPLQHAEEVVLGHLVIPNGSRMLTHIKDHFSTPMFSGFLDEQGLRSIVASQLGPRRDLAMNVDIAVPFGCAVVDFQKYDKAPIACLFGYKGGAEKFVEHLGKEGQKSDKAGHIAVYEIEGNDVYVDALKDSVVLTGHGDLFSKTSSYLERNIVNHSSQVNGDVEVVAYVAQAWDQYGTQIEKFFKELEDLQKGTVPETGNPKVDRAIKTFQEASNNMQGKGFKRLAEYEQATFVFGVSPDSAWMDFAFIPKPGTEVEAEGKKFGGRVADRAFIEGAPTGTIALIGWNADLAAADTQMGREARTMFTRAWAELTGGDGAAADAAVADFMAKGRELYSGDGVMALVHEPGAVAAVYFAQKLNAGKSAREDWKTWSQSFTPEVVLGAELAKLVTWSFTPDAGTAGSAPIDRWVIEPTPAALQQMKIPDEAKPEIEKWIGAIKLTIDRMEVGGRVIYTIAPKRENDFATRAVAAAGGTGSLKGDAGLNTIFTVYSNAATVGGVDVKKGVEWLKMFPEPAEDLAKLPGPLGNNLADLYLSGYYTKTGVNGARFLVGQPFIDQLRAFANKAG